MAARTSAAAIVAALFAAAHPAAAQQVAPSQITPPTLRPPAGGGGEIALPGAAGLAAPPEAANYAVTVGRVTVTDGFPDLAGANQALIDRLQGKRVTVAEIYAAANALEQDYAAAGYVLARVAVPEQRLVDNGPLRLDIIDGFVEGIELNGVPDRERDVVSQRMQALIGMHHVRLGEIERRLLLVSDVPGLVLRSTLTQGKQPGGTLLVLEATQNFVTGSLGIDDRLPKSLGTFALNATASLNSAFGLGEQIYFSGSSGSDLGSAFAGRTPLQILGGGFVLPIGGDGFTINPEYTQSITRPSPFPGAPATEGDFERFALRAGYPLIRSREQNLNFQISYEFVNENLLALGFATQLYKDRYQALRAQEVYNILLPWDASVQAAAVLSQGVTGRGSALAAASATPLSRQGTDPGFTKLNADLRYLQSLPEQLQLSLAGRGQTTFGRPVFLAEQFSLEGLDALSAFAAGSLEVDQGATMRAELLRPVSFDLDGAGATIAPYLFGAGGHGVLQRPTAVERGSVDAASAGIGLRSGADVTGAPYGGSLAAEFARKISNVPGEERGWRVNLLASVRF